jgi:hypothetical protein
LCLHTIRCFEFFNRSHFIHQTKLLGGGLMKKRYGLQFLVAVAAFWLLSGSAAQAQDCPEEPGAERALCNAFCAPGGCIDLPQDPPPGLVTACENIKKAYQHVTGIPDDDLPCENQDVICPCWDADDVLAALGNEATCSPFDTCTNTTICKGAINTTGNAATVSDNTGTLDPYDWSCVLDGDFILTNIDFDEALACYAILEGLYCPPPS